MHQKDCRSGFEEVQTIKIESKKFEREVRETLEIQKDASGPKEGGVNKDDGKYVNTLFWIPMMRHLHQVEQKARNREPRQRRHQNELNL